MSESFIAHIYFHEAAAAALNFSLYLGVKIHTNTQFEVFSDWPKGRKIQLTCLVIIFHFWKRGRIGRVAIAADWVMQVHWSCAAAAAIRICSKKRKLHPHSDTLYDPPPSHKSPFDIKPNLSTVIYQLHVYSTMVFPSKQSSMILKAFGNCSIHWFPWPVRSLSY